jgi:hypothetical protein
MVQFSVVVGAAAKLNDCVIMEGASVEANVIVQVGCGREGG